MRSEPRQPGTRPHAHNHYTACLSIDWNPALELVFPLLLGVAFPQLRLRMGPRLSLSKGELLGGDPGPTRVSLQQAFSPMKVTAGNSMLLLGHILILLGGVYLLVGQVRAPLIPPPHPEANLEFCYKEP